MDLARHVSGRGRVLDGLDLIGKQGLSGVVLGDKATCGGAETRETDETDGALGRGLGLAMTTTLSDRGT